MKKIATSLLILNITTSSFSADGQGLHHNLWKWMAGGAVAVGSGVAVVEHVKEDESLLEGASVVVNGEKKDGNYYENNETLDSKNISEGKSVLKAEFGSVVKNNGTLNVSSDKEFIGMNVYGFNSIGINNNNINITGSESFGIYASKGGIAINEEKGTINVLGKDSKGMVSSGDSTTVINKGTINTNNNTGIDTSGNGTAINDGIINVEGGNGIVAFGSNSTGATTVNNDIINVNNGNGMYALVGEDKDGSFTGTATIVNNGVIEVNNEWINGMSVSGLNAIAVNNKDININKNNGFGMNTGGNGTSINNGTINVEGGTGILAFGGEFGAATGVNNENIIVNSGIGMDAKHDGALATNNGIITVNSGVGMKAEIEKNGDGNYIGSAIVVNNDTINVNAGVGMKAMQSGAVATNNGNIEVNDENIEAKGMEATDGAQAINGANGTININGSGNIGMMTFADSSEAINSGTINVNAGVGMKAIQSGAVSTNNGNIEVNDENIEAKGMEATDGAQVINGTNGIININGNGNIGMMASGDGSEAINSGTINVDGINNTGMMAFNDGAIATNNQTINVNTGIGMKALNDGSKIVNNETIEVNGSYNKGMLSDGLGSTATNYGTINVNGDHNEGMTAWNGGTIDNQGTINLNGTNGLGIYIDNSSYLKNSGTIDIINDDGTNTDIINNGTIINEGEFIVDGEVDFDDMGDGKFILGEGGTIEADAIKGNFYASGGLTLGSYDDEYSTYQALKTNNIEGEIISNSAMFDADFTTQDPNGYYDIVMTRKDFNDIVGNSDLGAILEDNYTDTGDELKDDFYDSLKLEVSNNDLNKTIENSWATDIAPSLVKQSFDSINYANEIIIDEVINSGKELEVGEFDIVVGGNAQKNEMDGYDYVSGFETDYYSVYLGAERQFTKKLRLGIVGTVGLAKNEFTDTEASREDYIYQGSAYGTYTMDNDIKITSMVFGGVLDGSVDRTSSLVMSGSEFSTDTLHSYVGARNEVARKFNLGVIYLEPKAELNVTYLMQDELHENGDHAAEIDGSNNVSVETGLGVALGTDYYFEAGGKFNTEISLSGFAELADPYKGVKSNFSTLNESVTVNGYNENDYYGKFNLKLDYDTQKALSVFGELDYIVGNEYNEILGRIGLNLRF